MRAGYTGSGSYCYSDGLHMCLRAAGAGDIPETGFLECLTTMPFGHTYLRPEDGPPLFLFDGLDPERGLRRALDALGWECDETSGGDAEEAVGAVGTAPALVGPLDMGLLPYNPAAPEGADHYVVALEVAEGPDGDRVRVHDPAGFPLAVLDADELLAAWRAEGIDYKRGPYTLRAGFHSSERVGREEAIRRTLPLARENVTRDPGYPAVRGGRGALELLADDLRGGEAHPALTGGLVHFALPLAARRSLDASLFLREAGGPDAAGAMEEEALLLGEAQYAAARGRWAEVAAVVDRVAEAEGELAATL